MNKNIKKVGFDRVRCRGNSKVVCPYCGHGNVGQDEYFPYEGELDFVAECWDCGRNFACQANYHITFASQPLENYYLDNIESKLKRMQDVKKAIKNNRDEFQKEFFSWILKDCERELRKFKQGMMSLLEMNKWWQDK